ncbi:MAG: hypothetical protein WDW36_006656 [Sanguina aurantia]
MKTPMMKPSKQTTIGADGFPQSKGRKWSYQYHKASVLVLTFLCYMGYHAARKPPSIVKSVLRGPVMQSGRSLLSSGMDIELPAYMLTGWAPFNGTNGQSLLGEVDLAFLGTYALGMFAAGHFGDRMDLRIFLTIGMIASGVFTIMFGMGYFLGVHNFSYYIAVSILAGLFQSTGWPSVVSIVANWSGKGKRGLIMGIWNAHTSVGNILGTMIAAGMLSQGWGWSFVIPGALMIFLGLLIFAFLVVHPQDVGMVNPPENCAPSEEYELQPLKDKIDRDKEKAGELESIRFMDAWRIPGVASYAFCLFFSKLIAYTFLYWLPYYIKSTSIEGRLLSAKEAGDLSVLFDVGGVAGGIMAGHLSDKSGASAVVAVSFTMICVPCLYLYRNFGHISFAINIALMMLSGFFVNGPYALITTAVSADLGTHESLAGNAKALATVSAIIDGMGSIGAAIGPLMTGHISEYGGFDLVFLMLYCSAIAAGMLILKLAIRELYVLRGRK